MVFGIGLVLELPRQEPAVLLRQLLGLPDHARAALRGRSQDHLGAQDPHQLPAFDRKAVRHQCNKGVPLDRADHRERDARVARCRFHDGLSWADRAAALRVLDDRDRQPVLDRRQGVEGLALDVHRRSSRRQALDLDDGSVPDCAQDGFVNHREISFSGGVG